MKMISKWTNKWFLPLYDRNPLLGSVFGFASMLFTFLPICVFMLVIEETTGIPMPIVALMLAPLFVVLVKPIFMVISLASEYLWANFGIYALLKVEGRPVRNSYETKG